MEVGHVGKRDERGTVRQRHHDEVDHALVGPCHLPLDRLATVGDAGDGIGDARPGGAVVVELVALGHDLVDVWPLVEGAAREPPDLRQCRVVQLEPAVGLEHRDALLEAVQRLALGVDQGIVAALQGEPLGHVVVEIGQAAVGALGACDVDGAAVEQVPPVLVLGAGLVAGEQPRLPVAVAHLHLGQARQLAQAVEDLGICGLGGEPVGIQRPQLAVGLVEEGEALVGAEDGHCRGDAVERALVGGDVARELPLGGLDGRHVDGRSGSSAVQRQHDHVMGLARAPRDDVRPLAIGRALRQRAADALALARLQQLDLALDHLGGVGGLNRAHIGLVDPIDAAIVAAKPHRHRQGVEQGAARLGAAGERAVLVEDPGEVALPAGHLAQTQDGAPAGGAAVGLHVAPGGGLEQLAERPAVGEQRIEAVLEDRGGGGVEPGAELEDVGVRCRQAGDTGQCMHHHAHALALLPQHQHLRLGLDDGFGRQQALAQFRHLVARPPRPAVAPERGHYAHGGRQQGTARGGAQGKDKGGAPLRRCEGGAVHHRYAQRKHHKRAGKHKQCQLRPWPAQAAVGACQPHEMPYDPISLAPCLRCTHICRMHRAVLPSLRIGNTLSDLPGAPNT